MIHTLLNVVYVLVAIAMIVLILLQRGVGAQAGSGFGAGASGTVFGARGSANFLSSSTKWLGAVFFAMSLFMAWQASRDARAGTEANVDLGVMAQLPAASTPAKPANALAPAPAASTTVAPAVEVPPANATAPIIAPATPAANPNEKEPPAPVKDGKGG